MHPQEVVHYERSLKTGKLIPSDEAIVLGRELGGLSSAHNEAFVAQAERQLRELEASDGQR